VGVDERRGDQRAVELDHGIDPVSVGGGILVRPDPRYPFAVDDQRRRDALITTGGASRAVYDSAAIQRGGVRTSWIGLRHEDTVCFGSSRLSKSPRTAELLRNRLRAYSA